MREFILTRSLNIIPHRVSFLLLKKRPKLLNNMGKNFLLYYSTTDEMIKIGGEICLSKNKTRETKRVDRPKKKLSPRKTQQRIQK